jgi:hypothetical protein
MKKVIKSGTVLALLLWVHLPHLEAVFAQTSQINADDTVDAINYGTYIHLGWVGLPVGTTKVVLSRASNQAGPWLAVLIDEYPEDLTSSGRILYTDKELVPVDTTNDYFYKLEAFSATGILLRSYLPVFVPRFLP